MRWFRTSVHCPVCRADIRDYDPLNTIRNPHNDNASSNSTIQNRVNNETIPEGDNRERPNQNGESLEAIFTFSNLLTPNTFTSSRAPVRNRQTSLSDDDSDVPTTLV